MKNKFKLLVIAPYFYPKIGGVEYYAYNISKGLKEIFGWDVVIITANYREKRYVEENLDGMKIYRLSPWLNISNTPVNPLWYFQIGKIIKNEKPDVINAHSPVPFMADIGYLTRNKTLFILTYHAGSMIKHKLFVDSLIKLYEMTFLNILFNNVNKIITSSPGLVKKFLFKYSDKVECISPGFNPKEFKPGPTNNKNTIIYCGRIEKNSEWKGIKYLLDAVKLIKIRIPSVKLNLIGSGDYVDYYKKYSSKLGIEKNVYFLGSLVGNKRLKAYQEANVLVLPSVTEAESFGMVLIEAMACKKPVIGSDIGGIPYVIDNKKTGLLVHPKDSDALSEAIITILRDAKLARKMGEYGYKNVMKNYQWKEKVRKTRDLIYKSFNKI